MELLKTWPQSSVFPCPKALQTKEDFSELVFAPHVFYLLVYSSYSVLFQKSMLVGLKIAETSGYYYNQNNPGINEWTKNGSLELLNFANSW